MNISVVQAAPCRKNVTVEIPPETVDREFHAIQGFFAKQATLPGFRTGRAPVDLVARKFAREIGEEVGERLVGQAYKGMVEQEKIEPVSIVDVRHEPPLRAAPFKVDFVVDVAPVFDAPDWKQIRIEPRPVDITDQQVEDRLADLRLSRGTLEEVEDQPSAAGDFIQLDYSGAVAGAPLSGRVPAEHRMVGEATDFWAMLGSSHNAVPGLLEAVTGMKKGESRVVTVTFPAAFQVADLAGQEAQYQVTVKGIRRRRPAEMTDDFLKAFGVESEAELRSRIRDAQTSIAEREEHGRQRTEAIEWLIQHTPIADLPESVVAQETRRILRRMVLENVRNGVPQAELENHKDDLFQSASAGSQGRVKLQYILHKIADDLGIEPTEEEVEAEYGTMAAQMNLSVAKARQRIQKEGLAEALRDNLREEKTLARILSHALGGNSAPEGKAP